MYKIIEESNDLLLTHIRDESSFFFFSITFPFLRKIVIRREREWKEFVRIVKFSYMYEKNYRRIYV